MTGIYAKNQHSPRNGKGRRCIYSMSLKHKLYMQPRIVTLFTVFTGFCRQTRWIMNRKFIKHLPLKTLIAIRSGEISEGRFLRIVNIAFNTGLPLSEEAVSLEDIFFEVYNKVSQTDEFERNREFRFGLEAL